MRRLLLWTFLGLPAVLSLGALALVVAIVEDAPAVSPARSADADDRARARDLLDRFRARPARTDRQDVTASAAELNSLFRFLAVTAPRLAGAARVGPGGVTLRATVRLPPTPLGRYVNVAIAIAPGPGLNLGQVRIGRLELPGRLALDAVIFGLDKLAGAGAGAEAIAAIGEIRVSGDRVRISYRSPREIAGRVTRSIRKLGAGTDPERVRTYYARLLELRDQLGRRGRVSLARYIQGVFQTALMRSAERDPVAENRAALLALALYFGDPRLERLIGQVRTVEMKQQRRLVAHVRLAGRVDLTQHFTLSAGLALTAGGQLGGVLWEIKEVRDAGAGGSGFSFADLAADRAGLGLARTAIDPRHARRLQALLAATADEANFFPSIAGLPEGLSEAEFQSRYGAIDSAAYRAEVAEIDRRLAKLPALAGG